jgi:glycosyltransferase involved in cell wall biosynthesis
MNGRQTYRKRIAVVFPKDSESFFNRTTKTFGGATVQLYNFARQLSETNRVTALLPLAADAKELLDTSIDVSHSYSPEDAFYVKILKFHRTIRGIKPDLMLQRGLSALSPFVALYCWLYGIGYVFMFAHDREVRGRYQRTGRKNRFYFMLLFFARLLVVQTEYQKSLIPRIVSSKVRKITNAYQISEKRPVEKGGILRVSRLEPWKRPEKFMELAKSLPDQSFVMIAPVVPGFEDYAALIYEQAEYVTNLELIPFVHFDRMDDYFSRARVFVNTSTEEGFPNTFVQACKNRTPIVSLRVNPDNVIERYRIGFSCNDHDDILRNAVRKILVNDRIFRQFSDAAFEYAREHHSIEANARALAGCF